MIEEPNFFYSPYSNGIESQFPCDGTAIEYHPKFDLASLSPVPGNIFQVYIDQRFISFSYEPISRQQVFGSTYYAPFSDLSAIAFHTGCLFVNPKMKNVPVRRFCTVQNLLEALSVPEQDYSKAAQIFDYPIDLTIQGVLVHFYIDDSPGYYPSVNRNGIRSQEWKTPEKYCIKIIQSAVITMYDQPPKLVAPSEYQRTTALVPKYIFTFTGELAIVFTPQIFIQIFSKPNISKGLFRVFRVFFDVGRSRYEIVPGEKHKFKIVLDLVGDEECREVIVRDAEMTEFFVKKKTIGVNNHQFSPVDAIMMSQCNRTKLGRSTSINKM
ncbi:hypothetical protein TRFO_08315 [Tritrichomonas foetus]|uniref:Uncharacterized protein n=1 Tax=Tritrichomonas foetus TaxID=1144522 RepID=A0A1J4JKN6_9EUKA|nr:hypothetical protein TRFO_08315 [Tritrichomonas foetus]|eukprot:OHS99678.1 hypothetical protein TRFO_08315 [Tritrichomonas foetus]